MFSLKQRLFQDTLTPFFPTQPPILVGLSLLSSARSVTLRNALGTEILLIVCVWSSPDLLRSLFIHHNLIAAATQ